LKYIRNLTFILIFYLPSFIFSNTNCDGNTYQINQCLKAQMAKLDTQITKTDGHNIKMLKNYRNKICSDISSSYKGGTFEAIKYGNCIISFDKWLLEQMKK
jgi:uncharacterized protein YecT (DUF1311 family)